jgi:hypothetical protein
LLVPSPATGKQSEARAEAGQPQGSREACFAMRSTAHEIDEYLMEMHLRIIAKKQEMEKSLEGKKAEFLS